MTPLVGRSGEVEAGGGRRRSHRAVQETPLIVRRVRVFAVALALVVVAFLQKPAEVAADTKLDLVVDPLGFLIRAVGLWDPTGYAGQLQNQAYGYLFPMGPFFVLGQTLQIDEWMIQRLWFAALLVGAFGGAYRLLNALRIGTSLVRVIAALTYALAPRMLTELGGLSSEVVPFAVAPWVLAPLVNGARGGSPRKAAAASGVAFLFAGGINAAASLAILPLSGWWLLTREKGPRRTQLMRWWALCIGLASLWWVVPLVVLGSYSPPFLDWIESSAITTSATDLLNVWRGTSQWVARVSGPDGPEWTAGWILLTAPAAVIATTVVAAAGLVGAVQRSNPHRLFLGGGILIGLAALTFGNLAALTPPWAPFAQDLLDGPLAPFRNIHKFDPVLRLTLTVGLAHLLAAVRPLQGLQWREVPVAALVRIGAAAALLVAAVPAVSGQLVNRSRDVLYPAYWQETADWLAENAADSRGLVVPGAPFGLYYWGRTNDDVLQPLAESGWLVRDGVPLSSAGNIRLLDAFDQLLADGQPSTGLATALAGAGIGYVVVRNDLDWQRGRATRPELVHEALDGSPGLELERGFGPKLTSGGAPVDPALADPKTPSYQAVEIYKVTAAPATVRSVALENVLRLAGGPEATLSLAEQGLPVGRPTILAGDDELLGDTAGTPVITDTLRRREVNFGEVRHNTSETLTADEPFSADRAAHDYLPTDDPSLQTVAKQSGVTRLRASSSGSDIDAVLAHDAAHSPWAAVDGDPDSVWTTGSSAGAVGQWLEMEFDRDVNLDRIQVTFDEDLDLGPLPTKVEITTDRGSRQVSVRPTDDEQSLATPSGSTRRLRLTIRAVEGGGAGIGVAIATVTVPGLSPSRTLVAPSAPGTDPAIVVFRSATTGHTDCLTYLNRPYCLPNLATPPEEPGGLDRTFALPVPAEYAVSMSAVPVAGEALNALLDPGQNAARATSRSVGYADPRTRPQAVFDGAPDTVWIAKPGDKSPELVVDLPAARRVTGIRMDLPTSATAAPASRVRVISGNQQQEAQVLPTATAGIGEVRFTRPMTGSRFVIRIVETALAGTDNAATRLTEFLPPGIGELTLLGAEDLIRPMPDTTPVSLPCGKGPVLTIDGQTVQTQVGGATVGGAGKPLTIRDVLAGRPVQVTPCGNQRLRLTAGTHRLQLTTSDQMRPVSVMLAPLGSTAIQAPQRTADVREWGATSRSVDVGPANQSSVLVVPENFNDGWSASLNGESLVPIRIDGWQQAWIVPAGDGGTVELSYGPRWIYWGGLFLGLIGVVLLIGIARRRPTGPVDQLPPPAYNSGGKFARRVVLLLPTLIAGGIGLVGTLVGWFLVHRTALGGRRFGRWIPVLGGLALVAAGIAGAYRPFAQPEPPLAPTWPVQALGLFAAIVVALAATLPTPPRSPEAEAASDGQGRDGAGRDGGVDREVVGGGRPGSPPGRRGPGPGDDGGGPGSGPVGGAGGRGGPVPHRGGGGGGSAQWGYAGRG